MYVCMVPPAGGVVRARAHALAVGEEADGVHIRLVRSQGRSALARSNIPKLPYSTYIHTYIHILKSSSLPYFVGVHTYIHTKLLALTGEIGADLD
jgi:hypothetical protein